MYERTVIAPIWQLAFINATGPRVGESGFGRIHGADGLKEFTRAKAITRQRFASPLNLTTFRKPKRLTDVLVRVIRVRYGRG